MPSPTPSQERFRRRLVGMYGLYLMEREGPVHGYRLSEVIAERTQGAWRPGPGSVYPSLRKLVDSGFATCHKSGRRQTYAITPEGRQLLRTIRSRSQGFSHGRLDGTMLWAEILGERDAADFLIRRLQNTWESFQAILSSDQGTPAERDRLRERLIAELTQTLQRFSAPTARGPVRRGGGVRG